MCAAVKFSDSSGVREERATVQESDRERGGGSKSSVGLNHKSLEVIQFCLWLFLRNELYLRRGE